MPSSWTEGCRLDGWRRRRSGYSGTTGNWRLGVDKVDPLPLEGLVEAQVVRRCREVAPGVILVGDTGLEEVLVTDPHRTAEGAVVQEEGLAPSAARIHASAVEPAGNFPAGVFKGTVGLADFQVRPVATIGTNTR